MAFGKSFGRILAVSTFFAALSRCLHPVPAFALGGVTGARKWLGSPLRLRGGLECLGATREPLPKIPAFLMMPLDTVNCTTGALNEEAISMLADVAKVGAEGIMVDVWWGQCEQQPQNYDFSAYVHLLEQCRSLSIKVQAVMSFHACGGNIGDSVNVPLPQWVLDLETDVPQLFYRDQRGDASREYISLSCDDLSVFPTSYENSSESTVSTISTSRRTAIDCYKDFMSSFAAAATDYIADGTLAEIQVGCGPCGELRYPSYPLAPREHYPSGWRWPGIGELQCYDKGMLADMQNALGRAWPPIGVGEYNDAPDDTKFWARPYWQQSLGRMSRALLKQPCKGRPATNHETFHSESGAKFLTWYSQRLISHGRAVMRAARAAFGPELRLACKVSGIHWLRAHPSHAAEATAGYVGAYLDAVCKMLREVQGTLDFTCFEMRDSTQSWFAMSRPRSLVAAAAAAAARAGVDFAGENALPCWGDEGSIETIEEQCEAAVRQGTCMVGFTILRLEPWLVQPDSVQRRSLARFIRNLGQLSLRGSSRTLQERAAILSKRAWDSAIAYLL